MPIIYRVKKSKYQVISKVATYSTTCQNEKMFRAIKYTFAIVCFLSLSAWSPISLAQSYHGDITPQKKEKIDEAARPIPRIFSSKLVSTQQAERLDAVYNDLLVSLWLKAETDFVYQKKLFAHMEPERFKITRYEKEFSGDLALAMDNLNTNYKKIMDDITNTEKQFALIREGMRTVDYEILDPLWEEKMNAFKALAEQHFKMQFEFLKTYKALINFILKEGGGYYHKSGSREVNFYKISAYTYFAGNIDKLRNISYEQKKLLRSNPPANIDVKFD